MLDKKNVDLFTSHKVYSETELSARHEVLLENYCKIINIEALTMLDMVRKDILPAMSDYSKELSEAVIKKGELFDDIDCSYEKDSVKSLCAMIGTTHRTVKKMEQDLLDSKAIEDAQKLADFYKTTILDDMRSLRIAADGMETIASAKKWPYPSYGELLFGVR